MVLAAAGSVASQALGIAIGAQSGFSWKGVGLAALGAGIGGALGGFNAFGGAAPGSIGGIANAAVRGIAGSVLTQGIGVATGLQSKFDFAGVAAAGIGAGAADFAGARTASWTPFGSDLATGMASALANAATRSAVSGNSFGDNLIAALPDAIGGALGRAGARGAAALGRGESAVSDMPLTHGQAPENVVTGNYDLFGLSDPRAGLTVGIPFAAEQSIASILGATSAELDLAATFANYGPLDPHRALMTWDPLFEEITVTAPLQVRNASWLHIARPQADHASGGEQYWGGKRLDPLTSLGYIVTAPFEGAAKAVWGTGAALYHLGRTGLELNSFDPAVRRAAQARAGNFRIVDDVVAPFLLGGATAFDQVIVHDNPRPILEFAGGEVVAAFGGHLLSPGVRWRGEAFANAANSVDDVVRLTPQQVKAKVIGTAQQTGNDGTHAFRSYREAILLARNPEVEAVYLNRGYNAGFELAPKTISPNRRPDVLGRYFDGRVDRVEVFSRTDDALTLRSRNTFLDPQIRAQGFTPLQPRVVYPVRK